MNGETHKQIDTQIYLFEEFCEAYQLGEGSLLL